MSFVYIVKEGWYVVAKCQAAQALCPYHEKNTTKFNYGLGIMKYHFFDIINAYYMNGIAHILIKSSRKKERRKYNMKKVL